MSTSKSSMSPLRRGLAVVAFLGLAIAPALAHADWSVEKHPLGPGYKVVHDSGSADLVNNTTYKTERGAKKAAKALNKAEKKAEK